MTKVSLLLSATFAIFVSVSATAMQVAENPDIVVTAQSLKDTEKKLKDCLARQCPPDEDINATLTHAENQFVAGEYQDARQTILSGLGRNRKFKETYPLAVSDLWRANGNVANHLGIVDSLRISVLHTRNILKAALPSDDSRVLGAQLAVADYRLEIGNVEAALLSYRAIGEKATALNNMQLAGTANLRYLSLLVQIAESGKQEFQINKARNEISDYIAKLAPGSEPYLLGALLLQQKVDPDAVNADGVNAMIARFSEARPGRPVLIKAPPIETISVAGVRETVEESASRNALDRFQPFSTSLEWVDIGFWITSDGKVEDVRILRNEGATGWTKPVLTSIDGRVYTKTKGEGFYAVERYTFTAEIDSLGGGGSRIARRSAQPTIKRIDLSL